MFHLGTLRCSRKRTQGSWTARTGEFVEIRDYSEEEGALCIWRFL
jgi:hypothetical protein